MKNLIIGNQRPQIGEKSKKSIVEGLDNLIKRKLSAYKKRFVEFLNRRRSAILKKSEKQILKLKTTIKPFRSTTILKHIEVISYLAALQKTFCRSS